MKDENTIKKYTDWSTTTNELLQLFNKKSSRKEYLNSIVELIRCWSDCRCLGIRLLDEDGNIPYESYVGFSEEFWKSENFISIKVDQCACIRVVTGKLEPQDFIFMTRGGSFHCNNLIEVFNGLSEKERARFRGVCVCSGFSSIAVVPLNYRGKLIGAVHIADEKEGMVPMQAIEFIESVAPLIGEAVNRFNLEDELKKHRDHLEELVQERTIELKKANEQLQHEINERNKAEISLSESEERYCYIMETANMGIWVIDAENKTVFINNEMAKILEHTPEEMREKPFFDFLDEEIQIFVKAIMVLKRQGISDQLETRFRRKDGSEMWVILSVSPIFNKDRGYDGALVMVTDITERKKMEDELRKHRDHLEEMVQERTIEQKKTNEKLQREIVERKQIEVQLRSLAAELSITEERERRCIATDIHDYISQSLAVAKMKVELLGQALSSTVLSEKTEEIRKFVEEAIKYSRSLTFDLSPPVLYELGLEAAVEWLCEQFYERYGIQITFEDDRQPKPMDDEVRVILFKALRELLINNVKHAKAKLVNVSLQNCGKKIRVLVKDNGIGFDTSTIDFNKNCGFGFFSIRERLRFLGGNMTIKSKPGHGTCITLEAPLKLN